MIGKVEITYDGNDAERHVIDAMELAESLGGFARILATAGHFAITGEFVRKLPAQNARVFVAEAEPKCFNLLYEVWELAKQQQVFQGFAGAILAALVAYIVAKAANNHEEVKHLAAALQTALSANGQRERELVDRMFSTIDKMADSLKPAVKQAVTPIGGSASQITVNGTVFDSEDKAAIMALASNEVTDERPWAAVITELDRENATGKVRLAGDDESRVPISITDPLFRVQANPYLSAFIDGTPITLVGKAELNDGDIRRLFISNVG